MFNRHRSVKSVDREIREKCRGVFVNRTVVDYPSDKSPDESFQMGRLYGPESMFRERMKREKKKEKLSVAGEH